MVGATIFGVVKEESTLETNVSESIGSNTNSHHSSDEGTPTGTA